jgi:hypothetical protein
MQHEEIRVDSIVVFARDEVPDTLEELFFPRVEIGFTLRAFLLTAGALFQYPNVLFTILFLLVV